MSTAAIQAAVTALRLASSRVNRSAHNIANINTPGYVPSPEVDSGNAAWQTGHIGTSPMVQGPILPSESPLDLAINGQGFFVLDDGRGGEVYSKAGNFMINRDRMMTDVQGREVVPRIEVPPDTMFVSVTPQGEVVFHNQDGAALGGGQLETATFANPGGLTPLGGGAFQASRSSGPPSYAVPGSPGHDSIIPGSLQQSATNLPRDLLNLSINQTQFHASISAVRTSDEMLWNIMDVVG